MGAREYDPFIGRFISVDPEINHSDPQTLHGYSYANNSPISFKDATGRNWFLSALKGAGHGVYDSTVGAVQSFAGYVEGGERLAIWNNWDALQSGELSYAEYALALYDYSEKNPVSVNTMVEGIKDLNQRTNIVFEGQGDDASYNMTYVPFALFGAAVGVKTMYRGMPRGPICHSFDPATPVLMADGATKPIKDIQVGDEVLATDPHTDQTEAKPVTATHINQDDDLTDVTVRNQNTGQTSTIHTTPTHQFWNTSTKQWTDAAQLPPGAMLHSPEAARVAVVTVTNRPASAQMYDLTVADTHTYYVVTGSDAVLVHNCNKNQGVYVFEDQWNPGKIYVGKTNNFQRRLREWTDEGRLTRPEDARCIHVCGKDTDLYVAEYLEMQRLRRQGHTLSNKNASPGAKIYERRRYEQLNLWE